MTKISLDPAALPLYYPKASAAMPVKLRLIAQVCRYDVHTASLLLRRFPNLPPLHTQIDLEEDAPSPEPASLAVDVSHILQSLSPEETAVGVTVSILGFYDGVRVTAVECVPVNGSHLLGGGVDILAAMASLRDF